MSPYFSQCRFHQQQPSFFVAASPHTPVQPLAAMQPSEECIAHQIVASCSRPHRGSSSLTRRRLDHRGRTVTLHASFSGDGAQDWRRMAGISNRGHKHARVQLRFMAPCDFFQGVLRSICEASAKHGLRLSTWWTGCALCGGAFERVVSPGQSHLRTKGNPSGLNWDSKNSSTELIKVRLRAHGMLHASQQEPYSARTPELVRLWE